MLSRSMISYIQRIGGHHGFVFSVEHLIAHRNRRRLRVGPEL
jgi:hypothetical protein